MALGIYDETEEHSRSIYNDSVTVIKSRRKRLNKLIYADHEVAYQQAAIYDFFSVPVANLDELCRLVRYLLARPHCCLIRGIPIRENMRNVRRIYREGGEHDVTIIEQPQSWFAVDIDGHEPYSGDLGVDTATVLRALRLKDTECFSIASAGYGRKPGIRLRLFLWASNRVTCSDLKKHFMNNRACGDLALYNPVQPVYTARPTFIGCSDKVKKILHWSPGERRTVDIIAAERNYRGATELRYTKKQAEAFLMAAIRKVMQALDGSRHEVLKHQSLLIGKLVGQELVDQEDAVMALDAACYRWDKRNPKKDIDVIMWGLNTGIQSILGGNDHG
jgi:hypothetical protein